MISPKYLRRSEVPAYIAGKFNMPMAYTTLAKLACVGGGPAFRKFGSIVLYDPADIDTWVESKLTRTITRAVDAKPLTDLTDLD
jgi:hypothetical protein